jgi:hypothetical protein
MTGCDSVLVRAYVKGSASYDSAGVARNGFVSLSLVTMSKNWTWREKSLGAIAMDSWKTYSIPVSIDPADAAALVPADIAKIDFFALQAYSHAFRGAIYVDWIVFKSKNGTSDTVYTFDRTVPEESNDNVVAVSLVSTDRVEDDQEWKTATTTKWGSTAIQARVFAHGNVLGVAVTGRTIKASFLAKEAAQARAALTDLQGRTIWSRSFPAVTGANEVKFAGGHSGPAILRIRIRNQELSASVYCP